MNLNTKISKSHRWLQSSLLLLVFCVIAAACQETSTTTPSNAGAPTTVPTPVPRDANSLVLVTDNHWDGNFMPTYVLKILLEEEMGYDVEVIQRGSIPETMQAVALGHADAFPGGWFPTHDFNFDKHPNLVHLGQIYGGRDLDAFEGWMVTSDLSLQYDITSVEDLLDTNVAQALDSDGDGRGEIIGCPDFWACAARNQQIMDDYGLSTFYDLRVPSSEPEMLDLIDNREANGQASIFYLYVPIAYPEDGSLSERAFWLEGTQSYLPLAVSRVVSRTDFVASHPDVTHLLDTFSIPGVDVSEGMVKIAREGRTPEVVTEWAREWIAENRDTVDGWLPDNRPAAQLEAVFPPSLPENTLRIAYTPDKEDLFLDLVMAFNAQRPPEMPPIEAIPVEMSAMLRGAVSEQYGAISPDSSVWLEEVDRLWQERNPDALSLTSTGNIARYALSPLVIATWESRAETLEGAEDGIGWVDMMTTVQSDPTFRWTHPSISTATGLLAVTAQFYSGAGKFENLSVEDLNVQENIDYVTEIGRTVNRYGAESEERVIMRILASGGYPLDAFVTQEQKVIYFNQNTPGEKLTAIYPSEGTFFMDHPLVLLDGPWVTPEQQRVFRAFADFVAEPEQQQMVLEAGYRPATIGATLDQAGTLITAENNVDPNEPRTLLQVPSPGVLEGIRDLWSLTKKPANIYLVVDTSGSMDGEKLSGAKGALLSFIDQIQGEQDQVALLEFNDRVRVLSPLAPLDEERMSQDIRNLEAGGGTLLYDAIAFALNELENEQGEDRINVVVAMTDGQSDGELVTVESVLREGELPVIIFTVGYGEDADLDVLERIAQLGEGEAYPSDPETINQLYELLSAYF